MAVIERDIFLHAGKSNELLKKAIRTFEAYLKLPPKSQEYYQARSFLKQGQGALEETLQKSKQLLGPLSPYSPQEVEGQRAKLLAENKIIVMGLSMADLGRELTEDEFLGTIVSPDEIANYLKKHFVSQSSGKRKLANIKMRMIIDKLQLLAARGQELQTAAQKRFQAG
jgi:hypothetical protein